jgi:large subunit ribosomal protein L21
MYAIVEAGGKQYKIAQGDLLDVEKINADKGDVITLDKVLLLSRDGDVEIGRPFLNGVSISCEVVSQIRDKKKIAFKYRRRKSSKSKKGHRQRLTKLMVKEIKAG